MLSGAEEALQFTTTHLRKAEAQQSSSIVSSKWFQKSYIVDTGSLIGPLHTQELKELILLKYKDYSDV